MSTVKLLLYPGMCGYSVKGGKERLVPVGSYAQRALQNYLVRARPVFAAHGKGTAALFLNGRGSRLGRQGAWLILKSAAEQAGLTQDFSPHSMRHSFATHLLQGGPIFGWCRNFWATLLLPPPRCIPG